MCMAKERDVDMVLLAGDLFHENKPSRKAMFEVMRSLRMNCYGDKPCELELLSDASETFTAPFNHVNYEDPDINVAIPVFSIHGNHDDPSGEGHYAALDILQMSGLVNYYGRTPQSDNIAVKPILLQKGRTKLALYGLSNVRDERLFRTFRDGHVKFFQPGTQKDEWFNLMSVHQNRHAYTETGYLPEHFLPSFMDLVIWGHEHECKIDPSTNAEQDFKVMQPGSSVATSLMPGEAVDKYVALLTVRGKTFQSENIRLKTVRPFVMEEIALADFPEMKSIINDSDNRGKVTRFLEKRVEALIEKANRNWLKSREDQEEEEQVEPPLPLVRLRVEYSAFDNGDFHFENPQRFSKRFIGKVANTNDVVQFHRKRSAGARAVRGLADLPEESVLAQLNDDNVKVEKLVQEFLEAQSLAVLPQNSFSDAVGQFVDKDDKHAMEMFVTDSLKSLFNQLAEGNEDDADEERLAEKMEAIKTKMEKAFAKGELKRSVRKGSRKPRPEWWDSDAQDGHWEDDPQSFVRSENESDAAVGDQPARSTTTARAGASAVSKPATSKAKAAPAAKSATTATANGRGRKKAAPIIEDDDDDDDDEDQNDVIMLDDDDDEEDLSDEEALFVPSSRRKAASGRAAPTSKGTAKKPAAKPAARAAPAARVQRAVVGTRQATLPWGSSQISSTAQTGTRAKAATSRAREPSEDEISDDDAFEPPPASTRRSTRR